MDMDVQILNKIEKRLEQLEKNGAASDSDMLFDKIMQIKDGAVSHVLDGSHKKAVSNIDALTGLPNKHYFIELSDQIIHSDSIQDEFAIVYFNIDKFQTFNDTYGFEIGDEFLKSVVKVLMEEFEYYLEARYSDDHFVVLTSRMGLLDKIERVHERVHSFQKDVVMEIKAGIYELDPATPVSKACDWAKLACDSIKYNYQEDYRFYDASLRDQLIKEKYIIDHIDEAVEKGYLKVYYQPVVRVLSGQVCGMESLVRWIDPKKGFLSPGDFIPVLEKHRLISKVDKFVIEQVCKDFDESRKEGYILVPVSINLSRLDFQLMDVCKEVNDIVGRYQIDKKLFHLEVTESALNDDADSLYKVIEQLKKDGYEVWLDDFGSEYSSLNTLQNFQFDVLKIDMKFFETFQTNESCKTIILSIVDMAKRLKMRTVAEGVETKEQFAFLQELGCDIAQGYYFYKPSPLTELEKQIKTVEKPDERSYYDDLGKVNLLSPEPIENTGNRLEMFFTAPFAIVELRDGQFSFLFTNSRYQETVRKLGIESIAMAEEILNNKDSKLNWKLTDLVKQCDHMKSMEYMDFIYNGSHCNVHIQEIAATNQSRAFFTTLMNMESMNPEKKNKVRERALPFLYSIYNRVDFMDVSKNRIDNIYKNALYFQGRLEEKDLEDALKKFAQDNIFPEEQETFLAFYDCHTLRKRISEHKKGYIIQTFRTMTREKGYLLQLYVIIQAGDHEKERYLSCVRDISVDAVQKVTELQNSLSGDHAMLNAALESAGAMVWKYDLRRKCLSDTGTLGETYHLPKVVEDIPEVLIAADYVHSDSVQDFRDFYEQVNLGEKVSQDFQLKSKDGSHYVWDRIVYTPVKDEQGRTIEMIGTSIDITEQKEKEHNYEEQIRLNKLASRNTVASMFLNLSCNQIIEVERKQEFFAFHLDQSATADDLLRIIYQYIQGKEEKKVLNSFTTCKDMMTLYEEGNTHFSIRHHLHGYNGWFESDFAFIVNPYTKDVEAMVILKDIHNEVLQEQVMEKVLKMDYESLVVIDTESGETVPFLHTREDAVMKEQHKLNDPVEGVAVYLRENCLDTDVERVIKETSLPVVLQRLEEKEVHMVSYTLKTEDQKHVHKRAIYTYLDQEKTHILCLRQDLTETVDEEEIKNQNLSEALLLAEKASQAKTEFLSRMSHDMRTPMNGILGLAALSEHETDVKVLTEYMEKIKESGKYLLGLINDTLDFQRIETGHIEFHPQVVKVDSLIKNIEEMISQSAKEKRITLKIKHDLQDENIYIRVDLLRMNQIFMNLLNNAIKFTPEAGTVELEHRYTGRDGNTSHHIFYVRDSGIGMSKKFLANEIFKPFSQEYNDMSMTYAGSGLGLSIVKKLVDLMGGRIHVESKMNKGTTFVITLDLEIVNDQNVEKTKPDQNRMMEELQKALKDKCILLVEDHPLNTEIAKKLLERMQCKVLHAANGREAVKVFEENPEGSFDAILMDIRMPVMGGLEAARNIRNLDREDAQSIPMIAMTANAYAEDIRSSMEAGMNAHLAKPIDPYLLYQTLVDLIQTN